MIYNRSNLLGIQFLAMTDLRRLTRAEFFTRLQLTRTVEPVVDQAFRISEEKILRERIFEDPHGEFWHLSFHGCLTGNTEIVTRQGIKPISELVGEAEILIPIVAENDGYSRSGRGQRTRSLRSGHFETVSVFSYGQQEVYDVHLRRGRQVKVVTTTAAHRWQLKNTSIIETSELKRGMILKSIKARTSNSNMVPFAVAQGFVFGDGTAPRARRDTAWIDIHHNGKDEAMLRFFYGHDKRNFRREGGLNVTQILNLPRTWKNIPDMNESGSFLISWLAGYFAADGTVSKAGQAILTSASLDAINTARGILSICGISYGVVNINIQNGTYPNGKKYSNKAIYNININVRDLPDWFFVLPKHAERARKRMEKPPGHKHDWEIVSVVETGRMEEVFCPVTSTGFFALSDELLTGNSQFPGNDPMACPRQALYRMIDFPQTEPTSRFLRQTADQGKTVESTLVDAWHRAGMLLSSPDPNDQTHFELPQAWLTSSVDAVILPPEWNKPLVVEVKQRKLEVVKKMQLGGGPFPEHISQIKVQIAFLRYYQERGLTKLLVGNWPDDLEPVTHGVIYYVARDDPLQTAEFRVDYDEDFFVAGVEKLKKWRAYFEEDHLPELNPGKRSSKFGHPHGWRWSYKPCVYCPFKKTCQLDFQSSTTQLSESIGIERAKRIRPDYDLESARLRVRARWQKSEKMWKEFNESREVENAS